MILGMARRRYGPIGRDCLDTLVVQFLVREDVEVEALRFEPGEKVGVGLEMPEPRAALLGDRYETRPKG